MTLKNLTTLVEQMKITLDNVSKIYTTKTQWKQLDTQRASNTNELSESLADLSAQLEQLETPTIDLSEYAPSKQVKQLDAIRGNEINTLKAKVEELHGHFHDLDAQKETDFSEYVGRLEWKQLDLIRYEAMNQLTKLVHDLQYIANVSGEDSFIQFNDSNKFGSDASFTYDRVLKTLKVENIIKTGNGSISRDINGRITSITRGDLTKTINRDAGGNIASISDEIQTITFSRDEHGISGWAID